MPDFSDIVDDDEAGRYPIRGPITGRPGDPRDGGRRKHAGTDIAAARGTPIPWDWDDEGEVVFAGPKGGYGNLVEIRARGKKRRYAHLDGFDVAVGDRVAKGQVFGRVGNTGKVQGKNGGFHLHYEEHDDEPTATAGVDFSDILAGPEDDVAPASVDGQPAAPAPDVASGPTYDDIVGDLVDPPEPESTQAVPVKPKTFARQTRKAKQRTTKKIARDYVGEAARTGQALLGALTGNPDPAASMRRGARPLGADALAARTDRTASLMNPAAWRRKDRPGADLLAPAHGGRKTEFQRAPTPGFMDGLAAGLTAPIAGMLPESQFGAGPPRQTGEYEIDRGDLDTGTSTTSGARREKTFADLKEREAEIVDRMYSQAVNPRTGERLARYQSMDEFYAHNPDMAPKGYFRGPLAQMDEAGIPEQFAASRSEAMRNLGTVLKPVADFVVGSPQRNDDPSLNPLENFYRRTMPDEAPGLLDVFETGVAPDSDAIIALGKQQLRDLVMPLGILGRALLAGGDSAEAARRELDRQGIDPQLALDSLRGVKGDAAAWIVETLATHGLDAVNAAGSELGLRRERPSAIYKPGGLGGQIGSAIGQTPYVVGMGMMGAPAPLVLGGLEAVSGAPVGFEGEETEEERGARIAGGLIMGGIMTPIGKLIPAKPFAAVGNAIDKRIPGAAALQLGERLHGATALAATSYPTAAVLGQDMPTWQEAIRTGLVGAGIGPAGGRVRDMQARQRATADAAQLKARAVEDYRKLIADPNQYKSDLEAQSRAASAIRRVAAGEHLRAEPAEAQRIVAEADAAAAQFPELAKLDAAALGLESRNLMERMSKVDEALKSPTVARQHREAVEKRAVELEKAHVAATEEVSRQDGVARQHEADVVAAETALEQAAARRAQAEAQVENLKQFIAAKTARGEEVTSQDVLAADAQVNALQAARLAEAAAANQIATAKESATNARAEHERLVVAAKETEGPAAEAAKLRAGADQVVEGARKAVEARQEQERATIEDPAQRAELEAGVDAYLKATRSDVEEGERAAMTKAIVDAAHQLGAVEGVDIEIPLTARIEALTQAAKVDLGPTSTSRSALHEIVGVIRDAELLDSVDRQAINDWVQGFPKEERGTTLFDAIETVIRDGQLPDGHPVGGVFERLAGIAREMYRPMFEGGAIDPGELAPDVRELFEDLLGPEVVAAAERGVVDAETDVDGVTVESVDNTTPETPVTHADTEVAADNSGDTTPLGWDGKERRGTDERPPPKPYRDMTEAERETAFYTDDLTGVFNQRKFLEVAEAAGLDVGTGLAAFDANNFGWVNKALSQGHGDQALMDVAHALMRAAEKAGIKHGEERVPGVVDGVYRSGIGDEFHIIGPKELVEQATKLAEEEFGKRSVTGRDPSTGFTYSKDVSLSGSVGETRESAELTLQDAKSEAKKDPDLAQLVSEAPLEQIEVDPERFQYKVGGDAEGGTDSLLGADYNSDLVGVLTVWLDPQDGRYYVINGHNRRQKALRAGAKTVPVKIIPGRVDTARKARSYGAMENISEGKGTAIDAATFFRDSQFSIEEARRQIPVNQQVGRDGIELTKLHDDVFKRVADGTIDIPTGVAIAKKLADPDLQMQAMNLVLEQRAKGRTLDRAHLTEIVDSIASAPVAEQVTMTLFGDHVEQRALVVERGGVAAYIKAQIAADKRAFGAAAREKGRLERGGNTIDADASKSIAEEARNALVAFDKFKNRSGPIAEVLDDAARQIADGQPAAGVRSDAYQRLRPLLDEALAGGVPGSGARGEANEVARGEVPERNAAAPDQARDVAAGLSKASKKLRKLADALRADPDQAEADAIARLKVGKGKKLPGGDEAGDAGPIIGDLADLLTIAAAKMKRGAADFADWSADFLDTLTVHFGSDYAEQVRPHLQEIHDQARAAIGDGDAPAAKQPWEMSRDELELSAREGRQAEESILVEVFGEAGAKEYKRLDRIERGDSTHAQGMEAIRAMRAMEEALSPEQRARLDSIPDWRELSDYENASRAFETGSPEAMGRSLGSAVRDLATVKDAADPSTMDPRPLSAYIAMKHAMEHAESQGWDLKAIGRTAIQSAGKGYSDSADAAYMLQRWFKPTEAAPVAPRALPSPDGGALPVSASGSDTPKAPWQMTRGEWQQRADDLIIVELPHSTTRVRRSIDTTMSDKPRKRGNAQGVESTARVVFTEDGTGKRLDGDYVHRAAVTKALADGKPIPPEVLAEYPDLAPKTPNVDTTKTTPKPTAPKPPRPRAWKAGLNNAEVQFASETHRDLFDIGAELRRSMSRPGKTSDRAPRDIEPMIEALAKKLKVTPEKVRVMALGVAADVRAQMKGVKDGETRTVTDSFAVDDIEETLRKRLEETVGVSELPIPGAGVTMTVGGGKRTGAADAPAPDVRFAPEQEAAYQASKELVPKQTAMERIKEIATSAWHKATRPYEHLQRGARHAEFFEDLKELEVRVGVASDKAITNMKGLLAGFSKEQYDLFNRKVVLDDLAEELGRREARNKGAGKLFPDSDPASTDLAFKFDPATLKEARQRVDAAVAADPRVAESLGLRKALWRKVTDDYLNAAREAIGFEPPMNRQSYFRNIILDGMDAKRTQTVFQEAVGFHAKTNDPFTKRREASNRNYLSDYVRAEHEALSLMLQRTREFEILRDIERRYNVGNELRQSHTKNWQDHIPAGYIAWQPKPGRQFYEALTVPETYMRELMMTGADPRAAIPVDELQKVLAAGRKNHEWVVPQEIAATLDALEADPQVSVIRKAVRTWKKFMLQGPHRFIKYNIRNVTGDADGLLASNPKAAKEIPAAAKDLYNFLYRQGAPSPELKRFVEMGGMQDLHRGAELGADVAGLKQFRQFYDKKGLAEYADPRTWLNAYNDAVGGASDAREALLRYALFRQYRNEMARNPDGRPDSFGASLPDEVMAIADLDRRAHRMSNDAIGAYNELTVMGKYLRDTAWPFWSWNEVNVKRYKRLVQNAFRDEKTTAAFGGAVMKGAGVLVRRSPAIALRVGKTAAQMSILSAGLAAYNALRFPEEEADLPADVRKRPHIVLGRDAEGNVLYFDRMGAVGDALEWFGKYDDQAQVVKDYLDGKSTWYQAIGSAAKNAGYEAANKLIQGLGPGKTIVETVIGQQAYPDAFRRRPIRDRLGYVVEGMGFGPEYRAAMGRPSRGAERLVQDQFFYQIDPEEAAYGDIRSLATKFDESISGPKQKVSREPDDRQNALYYYKQALRYGDKEGAERFLNEFASLTVGREVADRKTLTGDEVKRLNRSLASAIEAADPLYGLDPEERAEFIGTLKPRDRVQLEKAQKFWRETMMGDDTGLGDVEPRDFEMDPYGLMPRKRDRNSASSPELSPAAREVYSKADPVVRAAVDFDLSPPRPVNRKGETPTVFSSRAARTKEVWREAVRVYAPQYLELPAEQREAKRKEYADRVKAYVEARIDSEFPPAKGR